MHCQPIIVLLQNEGSNSKPQKKSVFEIKTVGSPPKRIVRSHSEDSDISDILTKEDLTKESVCMHI